MEEWVKIVVPLMLISVVIGGCISQDGRVTAAQIKSNALKSADDLTSYRFSANGIIQATGIYTINQSFIMNAVVDLANQELYATTTISNEIDEEYNEAYIINDVLYGKKETQGNVSWIKHNITESDENWKSYNQIRMPIELLEISDVEKLDDVTIDDVDCYVIKMIPDLEKYYELVMSQSGSDNESSIPSDFDINNLIKDWEVKCWVSKKTDLIKKLFYQITTGFPFFNESMQMTQEMEIIYYDYNIPVNIELPEETEDIPWSDHHLHDLSETPEVIPTP